MTSRAVIALVVGAVVGIAGGYLYKRYATVTGVMEAAKAAGTPLVSIPGQLAGGIIGVLGGVGQTIGEMLP